MKRGTVSEGLDENPISRTPRKRARTEASPVEEERTPRRSTRAKQALARLKFNGTSDRRPRRRNDPDTESEEEEDPFVVPKDDGPRIDELDPKPQTTPARRRGRPPGSKNKPKPAANGITTPSTNRMVDKLATPSRAAVPTPTRRKAADRSARRKSARALIERVIAGGTSDDEDEEDINREIYESSEEEDVDQAKVALAEEDEIEAAETPAVTPSKRRGRPPKNTRKTPTGRKKSPTPPPDLPAHELYFLANKPGGAKTSNNTLANLELMTHEEYFGIINSHKDKHAKGIEFLHKLHQESFPQWAFELSEGFSLCIYGYGSKRRLLHGFASYLHSLTPDHRANPIVIVNGYVRTLTLRDILSTVCATIDSAFKLPSSNAANMLHALTTLFSTTDTVITVVLNSIDAAPLRKAGAQQTLAQLAAHPQVRLVCSADTPDFPLLWDSGQRSGFNFCFHDGTTFAPFGPEMDPVNDVHELLGRRARRIGGKDGVVFVLRSLPENGRKLFELLVLEVLAAMDEAGLEGGSAEAVGVEYRLLYRKAEEEFICSNEVGFRTLLKEFHDHQIITSTTDITGTDMLCLPFRKEEIESILEDLME